MKAIDLTDRVFGNLRVVHRYGSMDGQVAWLCLCDCGNTIIVRGRSLRKGETKSCRCAHVRDMNKRKALPLGTKLNYITVIGEAEDSRILVRCDCGNEKYIDKGNFGATKSCGCMKATLQSVNQTLPNGQSARNGILYRYKKSAEIRGLSFELSDEFFYTMLEGNCEYCGCKPATAWLRNKTSKTMYNGIDRIDSSVGYKHGNVVSCCKVCNIAKSTMSAGEFIEWAKRVVEHATKKAKGDS